MLNETQESSSTTTPQPDISQPEAIETLMQHTTDEDLEKVLLGMVNEGGIPLDHESLRISGTYAHAARVANALKSITASYPNLITATMKTIEERQSQRDQRIVSDLKKLQLESQDKLHEVSNKLEQASNNLIQKSGKGKNSNSKLRDLMLISCSSLASMIVAVLIFSAVLIPQLVRQSKAGDAAFLDWTATTDGKMYQDIFRSGKSSQDSCKRTSKNKKNKVIICEIHYK